MSKPKKAASTKLPEGVVTNGGKDVLQMKGEAAETQGRTIARVTLEPAVRHASLAGTLGLEAFGDKLKPSINETTAYLADELSKVSKGDLGLASRILGSQAVTLDTMFTELSRRAVSNLGKYPDAVQRYFNLALRAQSNCRTTLEALAKLHQPREQTVRHVHVNEGGQAVIADQFHHHAGGKENAKSAEQPHATSAAGSGPAMLGHHAQGNGVPIPGGEGQTAMQDARRQGERRAQGQS